MILLIKYLIVINLDNLLTIRIYKYSMHTCITYYEYSSLNIRHSLRSDI